VVVVVAAIGAAVAGIVEAAIAVVGAGAVAAADAVGAVIAVVVAAPVACEMSVDDVHVAVGSDTSAGGFLLSSISRFLLRARSLRESGLSTSSPSFLYRLREKLTESLNSLDAGV